MDYHYKKVIKFSQENKKVIKFSQETQLKL